MSNFLPNYSLRICHPFQLEFSSPDLSMWRNFLTSLGVPGSKKRSCEVAPYTFIIPFHNTLYVFFAITVCKYLLIYLFTRFLFDFPQDGKMARPKSCLLQCASYLINTLWGSLSLWMCWMSEQMMYHREFSVCSTWLVGVILNNNPISVILFLL